MRFIAVLYASPDYYAGLSSNDMVRMGEDYSSFYNGFSGHISLSEGVHPANKSKILRTEDGKLNVTDGSSQDGTQEFGGFYLIECRDLDEAVAIAAQNPVLKYGTIEIWECSGPLLKPVDGRVEDEEKLDEYMKKVGVPRQGKTEYR